MATTFGGITTEPTAPADDSQPQQNVNGDQTQQSASAEPEIDINDPRLQSESLEYSPEADAYSAPPVLPDGKWRAKLTAREVGKAPKTAKFLPKMDARTNQPYLYTGLDASIIDHSGRFDGLKLSDYFVDTLVRVDRASGKLTSRVVTLLVKLGKTPRPGLPHGALMEELQKALAGEPEIGIETAWEWSCQKCQEEADAKGERSPRSIIGMNRFPQVRGADGKMGPDPLMKCPANPAHGESRARPRISRYLALTELK